MSKITPKNLHYDNSLPPFLARLQANQSARDGRAEYQAARPKRERDADEVAEDEPVYVDGETGEVVVKGEWEEAEREREEKAKESGEKEGEGRVVGEGEKEVEKERERVANIGVSKKRKAGKVVGGGDDSKEDDAVEKKERVSSKPASKKFEKGKPGKKGKKIKLSFGDDE